MASKELEIYSVVGCDLDYSTDDGDVCIYLLELRRNYCDVNEIDDGVYRFVDDFEDEHTGTMQELFELQQEGEEIFTMGDIDEEEFVYDGGIHQEPPIDDDDYDTKWGSEEFFISKEDALKHYKEEIEFAKNRKHSSGIYVNLLWYSSSPR